MIDDTNKENESTYASPDTYNPGSYDEYLQQTETQSSSQFVPGFAENGSSSSNSDNVTDNGSLTESSEATGVASEGSVQDGSVSAGEAGEETKSAAEAAAEAADKANILSKLRVGSFVTSMLSRIGGPFGRLARYLNLSIRLLSIITILFGGSALTLFGISLFGHVENPGRYVSLDECLDSATPYEVLYTDNENLSSNNNVLAAVETIHRYLSDPEFIDGVIDNGDVMENDPGYDSGEKHVDLSDAYTKWLPHNLDVAKMGKGMTDEAILGACANAYAESGVIADMWELKTACFHSINGTEQELDILSGGDNPAGQNLAMTSSHHRDWNSYVLEMEKYWWQVTSAQSADGKGVKVNLAAYRYHTMHDYAHKDEIIEEYYENNPAAKAKYATAEAFWNNTDDNPNDGPEPTYVHDHVGNDAYRNISGQVQYYPGIGLWAWTGSRAYALSMWANTLENVRDFDLDGANDAMYDMSHQIYYLVYENSGGFNGIPIPNFSGSSSSHITPSYAHGRLLEWSRADRVDYVESYYVNIPQKPAGDKTEHFGDRERYQIATNVALDAEDPQFPVLDFIYDSSQEDEIRSIEIDQGALATAWSSFLQLCAGHYLDEINPTAYEEYCNYGTGYEDTWKKISVLMQSHSGGHYEYVGIPPVLTLVPEDYNFWTALTNTDMLDVGSTKTIGSTIYSCGPTMLSNLSVSNVRDSNDELTGGKPPCMGKDECYKKHISIFEARMYYDYSSEVEAFETGTSTYLFDADGMNGSNQPYRPDNKLYGGSVAGDYIIYEASAENMTGDRATFTNLFNGDNTDTVIWKNFTTSNTEPIEHVWSESLSHEQRARMDRVLAGGDSQWGKDYTCGYDMNDFPGWNHGVFAQWWNSHVTEIETQNYEWDTYPYRVQLAANRGAASNKGSAIVPVMASSSDDSSVNLANDRLKPLRIWARAHAKAQVARLCAREFLCFWEGMGTGNVGMINSHSRYDLLVEWATSLFEDEWKSSASSTESLLGIWHEHMSTYQLDEWQRSFYRNYCKKRGIVGFGGIAEMAVAMAYLNGHDDWAKEGDSALWTVDSTVWHYHNCTDLYCAIKVIVGTGEGENDGVDIYDCVHGSNEPDFTDPRVLFSSCDRGACTAIRSSGADDTFPFGACEGQLDYLRGTGATKWEELGPACLVPINDMQPGDIVVSTKHILTFVGGEFPAKKWPDQVTEAEAIYSIVHSSISRGDRDGSRGLRCDISADPNPFWRDPGEDYYVFRLKGDPDESSAWRTMLDTDEIRDILGVMQNGTDPSEGRTGIDWID